MPVYRVPPERLVTLVERGLEPPRPPLPHEGTIVDVDLEHVYTAGEGTLLRCASCSWPVHLADPHVLVLIHLEDELTRYDRVHLCDASCWAAWASPQRFR